MEASTLTATATINNVNVHAAVTPSTADEATINNVNVHAAVTPSTASDSVVETAKSATSLDEK